MKIKTLVLLIFSLFLSGCMVGPKYIDPKVATYNQYQEQKNTEGVSDIRLWWENWNDPKLSEMIKIALENNYDFKIAKEKILETRALYQMEKANLFPEIDVVASLDKQKISKSVASYYGNQNILSIYHAGFDASWEIDFFGRIRHGVQAAYYAVASSIEEARNVRITLVAEVARNYIQAISAKKQILITEAFIKAQEEVLRLVKDKFTAGLVAEQEYQKEMSLLQMHKAELYPFITFHKSALYRLCYLLGKPMKDVENTLFEMDDFPKIENAIPVDLPSNLLIRRPDIRQAFMDFKSAFHKTGEATADLFPRFSLTGSFGLESQKLDELWQLGSKFWEIGPCIRWPLLDFGRIRSNISAKTHQQQEALLSYEGTILGAFQDVETAFVSYFQREKEQADSYKNLLARRKKRDLDKSLFASGIKDYQTYLLSAEEAYNTERNNTEISKQKFFDLIYLYKALGGGW